MLQAAVLIGVEFYFEMNRAELWLGICTVVDGESVNQQALQQLLVAAQSDPNDPRVYVYLADTYRWLGMDAESNAAAERAKQLDPNAFDILR